MDSAFKKKKKKIDLLERTYAQPVRTGGPSTMCTTSLMLVCSQFVPRHQCR